MPAKDRTRERSREKRRMEERITAGMCPKCGTARPAPGRSKCERCLEKARISDRARYAKAKAEGHLDGPNAESRRRASRDTSKRRYQARAAAGLCVRCGLRRPEEGRTRCGPCLERRNTGDRRQWASRLATGRCGACGDPAPDGRTRCGRCSAIQANRPSRKARARKIYARRRARNACVDCAAPLRWGGPLSGLRKAVLPALRRASRHAPQALPPSSSSRSTPATP